MAYKSTTGTNCANSLKLTSGVRLAKNDFGSVLIKYCCFRFGFGFTKLTAVSVFGSVFLDCVLFNIHDARNDIILRWIGPTNCQPKWLRTTTAEIRHEEKYVDCWSYHAARWIVNETTWKTIPKPPKSVFWKPNGGNRVFGFWILRSDRFLENRYVKFSSDSAHP